MDKHILALILEGYKKQIVGAKEKIQGKLPTEIGQHTKGPFGKYFFFPQLEPLDDVIDGLEKEIENLRTGGK